MFSPADRTIGTVHGVLWAEVVETDSQPPVPTLYPIVAIVVEAEPDVALAIPWNVTNDDGAYSNPDTTFGEVTFIDGYALTVINDPVP